jgi:O-antigen/teichoic acid export membrane protein
MRSGALARWKAYASAAGTLGAAGSFRRNTLVLTAGTLTAQVLPLALYPVFTRMFAPAVFGVYATVSLFASIGAIVATGAYEHAILIARSRRTAAHVAAYALLRSGMVLGILALVLVPFHDAFGRLGLDPAVTPWLRAVPLIAGATVIYTCYTEWCVRSQYFAELSRVRMWQTSAIAAARLGFGALQYSFNGFVAGDVVGKVASAARCGSTFWRRDRLYARIHTRRRMQRAARRYAHVARFALPDQLVNTLSGSLHVLFLGAAFGAEQLGYVTLVLTVMYVPVTVVSSAVKDVFRQRASMDYARAGTCRPIYRRLLLPLCVLGAIGFGALYLAAPTLFPLMLGSNWGVAGEYARILTPLFFWNFVSMSLGGVLVIAERTDVSLAWQFTNLLLTFTALVVGTRLFDEMVAALWCLSLGRAAAYLLFMMLSYYYAERQPVAASV